MLNEPWMGNIWVAESPINTGTGKSISDINSTKGAGEYGRIGSKHWFAGTWGRTCCPEKRTFCPMPDGSELNRPIWERNEAEPDCLRCNLDIREPHDETELISLRQSAALLSPISDSSGSCEIWWIALNPHVVLHRSSMFDWVESLISIESMLRVVSSEWSERDGELWLLGRSDKRSDATVSNEKRCLSKTERSSVSSNCLFLSNWCSSCMRRRLKELTDLSCSLHFLRFWWKFSTPCVVSKIEYGIDFMVETVSRRSGSSRGPRLIVSDAPKSSAGTIGFLNAICRRLLNYF